MTRFARAKGSKASNEKAPEDGTPWEVMKEQLLKSKKENEDAKNRQEAEKQRIENYENFLKEQKILKRKATWCDFPETQTETKNATSSEQQQTKKKKKNKQKQNENGADNNEPITQTESKSVDTSPKKSKNKKVYNEVSDTTSQETVTKPSADGDPPKKKKKRNKKPKSGTAQANTTQDSVPDAGNTDTAHPPVENKKKNKKNKNKNANSNEENQPNGPSTPGKNKKELNPAIANKNNKIKAIIKKKDKKLVDGKPVRRKEVTERSFQLIINGKDIELVRYDGFPIMKKDAERIEELKNSMIKKGIPKSEVQRTIKLERRRAEKALARLKRDVCYNCRKGGHNLSDCPELKSKIPGADGADGVCFKCGSTEHRQFECKVQRDKEFRFATCFICKESGHIARQCPDNPKGLYPNGGCCKLCGDVTHLRKDCPTVNDKKESSSMKLSTLSHTDNLEDIGQQQTVSYNEESSKKPKKITF